MTGGFEFRSVEKKYETEISLRVLVSVDVMYGDARINQVRGEVSLKRDNEGQYIVFNDTDWLNRYEIDPVILGERITKELGK